MGPITFGLQHERHHNSTPLTWLCTVQVFASHAQFKDWFSNPLTGMVEGQEAVNKVTIKIACGFHCLLPCL